ncbi:MAG: PAS domain-containing protein [Gemmatimonadales bacterium]
MARGAPVPTNKERFFGEDEIIVSKTDLTGKITYANSVFLRIADYEEREVIGMPHSMIRHPDMPRAVFWLLWDTIQAGKEIFAYVKNMARNGDHYWVLAHATPTFNTTGSIVGYHSNRRVPDRTAVEAIDGIYRRLVEEEQRHADRKDALKASTAMLTDELAKAGMAYEEFIWTLAPTAV